ncbi:MAG: hypothetical protein ABI068_05775 [Ktedonobacterales bacterium]
MRSLLRVCAFIIGLIGVFDGLVMNIIVALYRHVADALGAGVTQSHGFIGLIFCLVALIGAGFALRQPLVGGLLLLIGAVGIAFVLYWWALLVTPQLLVAAALAIADNRVTAQARNTQPPIERPNAPNAPRLAS